ncbi:MAG: pilus assembly protein PilM [Candidatus Omnitrophota bacterium]
MYSSVNHFTCLEISDTHIKLAQFEKKKKETKLLYLFTRNIPTQEEEVIIKTLKSLLSEIKVKGEVLSCLPRHQITVRYMKLPSHKDEELKAMLDFQITKQIPYQKEEMVYSYIKLGIDSSGYTDILLAITHEETVYKHLKLLKACNIEPERVSLNTLDTCEWFSYSYPECKETVLLIDVDTAYTGISVIVPSGKLLFSRAVKIGISDLEIDEDNSSLEALRDEIKISFSTFMKEYADLKIDKIILTGAISVLDKIKNYLKEEFVMEIEIKMPLEKIRIKKDVLEEDWFDMHRVSLTAVLGLGLCGDTPERLNLLPPVEIKRRQEEKRKTQIIFSAILIALIFLNSLGIFYRKFYEKDSLLRYLNNELKKIDIKAQELEEKKRNLELVNQLFSDRSISLDILVELYKIVPSEINLVNFDFEDGKGVVLRGTSTEMAAVFRLVALLDKTPYFSNSQVKFVRKRVGREGLTDFEIFSPLKSNEAN